MSQNKSSTLQPSGSLTSVTSLSDTEEKRIQRSTRNKKTNKDEKTQNSCDCAANIQKMIETWEKKQDDKFKDMQNILEQYRVNCEQYKETINFMSNQHEELKTKYELLAKEKDLLAARGQELENQIEKLQYSSKASCIEIRNVPSFKDKHESKDYLLDLVAKAGKTFNFEVHPTDLRDIYRTNAKPGSTKPIIAEFSSVLTKDKFIDAAKSYNRKNPTNRLNTMNLQLNCPKSSVFISEVLTSKQRKIHFLAREFAKSHSYTFCWVSHGRVYLREKENVPAIRVNNEKDLDRLASKK